MRHCELLFEENLAQNCCHDKTRMGERNYIGRVHKQYGEIDRNDRNSTYQIRIDRNFHKKLIFISINNYLGILWKQVDWINALDQEQATLYTWDR